MIWTSRFAEKKNCCWLCTTMRHEEQQQKTLNYVMFDNKMRIKSSWQIPTTHHTCYLACHQFWYAAVKHIFLGQLRRICSAVNLFEEEMEIKFNVFFSSFFFWICWTNLIITTFYEFFIIAQHTHDIIDITDSSGSTD